MDSILYFCTKCVQGGVQNPKNYEDFICTCPPKDGRPRNLTVALYSQLVDLAHEFLLQNYKIVQNLTALDKLQSCTIGELCRSELELGIPSRSQLATTCHNFQLMTTSGHSWQLMIT